MICIQMGSSVSHFNVVLIMGETRQCPEITSFEQKGDPSQTPADVCLLTS